jgi:copper chaperone NosL
MSTLMAASSTGSSAARSVPHRPAIRTSFLVAAGLIAIALALPWWSIVMHAPQYPDGLHVTTWFFGVSGDVREVDGLNHYIGFMPLRSIAPLERQLAFVLGPAIVALLVLAGFVRGRWAWLLAIPALFLPVFFVGDLAVWLSYAGNHLDPHAALSTSVTPWTPKLFGAGGVGQFRTFSSFGAGFFLSLFGAACVAYGLRPAARPGSNK